jgi:hypothetical protein
MYQTTSAWADVTDGGVGLMLFTEERTLRPPRCERGAGRSMEVICAGQAVRHGLLRSVPDDAVAAHCCCTAA